MLAVLLLQLFGRHLFQRHEAQSRGLGLVTREDIRQLQQLQHTQRRLGDQDFFLNDSNNPRAASFVIRKLMEAMKAKWAVIGNQNFSVFN